MYSKVLKAHQSTQDIYKVNLAKNGKQGTHKNYSLPHLGPNQSKKSTIFMHPQPIHTLTHIKESPISFLPDRPENVRSGSPNLNTSSIYKRVTPP